GKLVDRMNPDLLYVNGPRFLPPAGWVSNQKLVPLLFHCHHFLEQPSSVRVSGAALRFSDAFMVASCRYAADPLKKYVKPERIFVRYNGVAGPEELVDRRGRPLRRIAVIGRIEPEKGQLEFVH